MAVELPIIVDDGYAEVGRVESGPHAGSFLYRPFTDRDRRVVQDVTMADAAAGRRLFAAMVDARVAFGPWDDAPELDDEAWLSVGRQVFAAGLAGRQKADAANLHAGAVLAAAFPHLKAGICGHCAACWYDPLTNKTETVGGDIQPRPEGAVRLCDTAAGCPVGSPEKPRTLSEKNARAVAYWRETRRGGPGDAITRRNGRIIEAAVRVAGRRR